MLHAVNELADAYVYSLRPQALVTDHIGAQARDVLLHLQAQQQAMLFVTMLLEQLDGQETLWEAQRSYGFTWLVCYVPAYTMECALQSSEQWWKHMPGAITSC